LRQYVRDIECIAGKIPVLAANMFFQRAEYEMTTVARSNPLKSALLNTRLAASNRENGWRTLNVRKTAASFLSSCDHSLVSGEDRAR